MRSKTVIANRVPQPLLGRAARSECRPSHIAPTATAEEPMANAPRRESRKDDIARSPSPCCCGNDRRGGADTIAFRFCA